MSDTNLFLHTSNLDCNFKADFLSMPNCFLLRRLLLHKPSSVLKINWVVISQNIWKHQGTVPVRNKECWNGKKNVRTWRGVWCNSSFYGHGHQCPEGSRQRLGLIADLEPLFFGQHNEFAINLGCCLLPPIPLPAICLFSPVSVDYTSLRMVRNTFCASDA